MWEPPFSVDEEGRRAAKEYSATLNELLAAGRLGDALAHFMRRVGLSDEMIAGMRQSPYWSLGESLAPTLAYDDAAMGESTVPTDRYGRIGVPTLVLSGSVSPDFMREAARQVVTAIPGARHEVLDGQSHDVAPDVLAPAVARFRGLA